MPTLTMMALWLTTLAYGTTGVQLPPSEDPAAWAAAFDFAGLERHTPGTEPQIRIDITADGWTLRASDGQGIVRTATVKTPHTPEDREQVALVADDRISAD